MQGVASAPAEPIVFNTRTTWVPRKSCSSAYGVVSCDLTPFCKKNSSADSLDFSFISFLCVL